MTGGDMRKAFILRNARELHRRRHQRSDAHIIGERVLGLPGEPRNDKDVSLEGRSSQLATGESERPLSRSLVRRFLRSLEFIKSWSACHEQHAVEEFAGGLALGGGGHDGTEEGDVAHVDDWRCLLRSPRGFMPWWWLARKRLRRTRYWVAASHEDRLRVRRPRAPLAIKGPRSFSSNT